jgi:hypothetical protein
LPGLVKPRRADDCHAEVDDVLNAPVGQILAGPVVEDGAAIMLEAAARIREGALRVGLDVVHTLPGAPVVLRNSGGERAGRRGHGASRFTSK